ncbi:carboxylesterase family protein [Amycolatopsis acidicola]|uniref:Carboxylic ester hydrolase n=1 Tax=Amycolatopsis acidicola TaxID=2596893 RepID=A0A5N0UZU3_9PSEU|nr:carboxylesterase family protein [Amycolatopsis acidicola]KAA9156963.1 carboxylesterase family protein [Amycolatopsis acidicola]
MRTPVETESGLLRGIPGRNPAVTVFRGVPYAAPPVGELRWRAPQPPAPWAGVREAVHFGPMCPQSPQDAAAAGIDLPQSEDCLHLNVWTPANSASEKLPVLVWIYGGGFRGGTGANPRFDGEHLAGKGIVVVTFNYRLGVFGFLATPELSAESGHHASGNYGLLDDIAALKWVQRNISAFGGDPGRVTVAGQSAGAGSVNFLAMSPLARGLFHRAIAQSHTRHPGDPELRYLATSYRTLADAEQAGERFVRAHGGGSLAELRELPWRKLIDGHAGLDEAVETGSPAKPPLFRPVVDGWVIPHGYADTYALGEQNDVAYLTGNNLDESGAVPAETFEDYRQAKGLRPGAPPVHVTLDAYVRAAHEKFGPMAEEFLMLYPATNDDEAAAASATAVRDNSRVSTFLWGTEWTRHATKPVYTYFWTHASPAHSDGVRRASHSSEIDYVFGNLDRDRAQWTDEDREVAEKMSSYWANFVIAGDPNGPGLAEWPAYSPDVPAVMEVGAGFGPVPLTEAGRTGFWQRFFRTQKEW